MKGGSGVFSFFSGGFRFCFGEFCGQREIVGSFGAYSIEIGVRLGRLFLLEGALIRGDFGENFPFRFFVEKILSFDDESCDFLVRINPGEFDGSGFGFCGAEGER